MKTYIVVEADTNDIDYISQTSEITNEEIELIKPVIEQLKYRRDNLNENIEINLNTLKPNWNTSDYGNNKDKPEKMYVESNLLTQEQVDLFQKFVPYNGKQGVHTVAYVGIMVVQDEYTLF